MADSLWRWTPEFESSVVQVAMPAARPGALADLPAIVWAREVRAELVELQQRSGIPAAGAVVQMVHEAFNPGGQSLSRLAADYHNYAGLKWADWQRDYGGRPVSMTTWEEIDGKAETLEDAFGAFPDLGHFLRAYERLLTWPRYAGALAYAGQPLLWLHQVWGAGYATDSRYLAGLGAWMRATWSAYRDTLPAAPIAAGRPVAILDAGGRRLCEGWLMDPDGPGPEPERTVVRLRDVAGGMGLAIDYDSGGPAASLRWPGAKRDEAKGANQR